MKKRNILAGLSLLLILVLILLSRNRQERLASEAVIVTSNKQAVMLPKSASISNRTDAPILTRSKETPGEEIRKAQNEAVQRESELWNTPIEFYGKVVDENESPVPGARIHFVCNDLSSKGTSYYDRTSDVLGLFLVTGIRGKGMSVHVSKAGYYTSKRDSNSFEYAGENVNFTPNARSPVVFHMRKMGKVEPLMAIAGSVLLPKDGTPVGVSIDQSKVVPAGMGEILIQCRTENEGKPSGERYDWKCQLSVPGGGIQEDHDEFDFLAPESGYQPSIEIDMPASLDHGVWKDRLDQNTTLKWLMVTSQKCASTWLHMGNTFVWLRFTRTRPDRGI